MSHLAAALQPGLCRGGLGVKGGCEGILEQPGLEKIARGKDYNPRRSPSLVLYCFLEGLVVVRLSPQLAQSTVDKVMEVLPFSINLIDDRGIVVGSGDRYRLGTYHSAARRILATGQAVEVAAGEIDPPAGARPGLGLPIMFEGQPIGVIGLSGDPERVREYAQIVKALTELVLEHEALRERAHIEDMARKAFVSNLITGAIRSHEPWEERASLIGGIDMSLERTAVLVEIDAYGAVAEKNIKREGNTRDGELVNQRTKMAFYELVNGAFPGSQNMTLEIQTDRMVILAHPGKVSGERGRRCFFDRVLNRLRRQMASQLGLTLSAGVSMPSSTLDRYSAAYREATQALCQRPLGFPQNRP